MNWIFHNSDRSTLPKRVADAVKSQGGPDHSLAAVAVEIARELGASHLIVAAQHECRVVSAGTYSAPGFEAVSPDSLLNAHTELITFLWSIDQPMDVNDLTQAADPSRLIRSALLLKDSEASRGTVYISPTPISPDSKVLIIVGRVGSKRRALTDQEKGLLETTATYLGLALNLAGAFRDETPMEVRKPYSDSVKARRASVHGSLELDEILRLAVEELSEQLGAGRISVDRIAGARLERVAGSPEASNGDDPLSNRAAYVLAGLDHTPVAADLAPGKYDLVQLPGNIAIGGAEGLAGANEVACPIFAGGEMWGVLTAGGFDLNAPVGPRALVEAVASRLEIALSHAMQMKRAEEAALRERLIIRIIELINESSLISDTFPTLARELGEHLACDSLIIASLRSDQGPWNIECEYRKSETAAPRASLDSADYNALFHSIQHGPLLCDDVECDERLAALLNSADDAARTRALMVVPITYEETLRLAIVAGMSSAPRKWTNSEAEILRTAADQILIALQRTELFEMVSRSQHEWESTFDALSDGIFIFDSYGRLSRANSAAAALEGAAAADLIGRSCCDLLQGVGGQECRVGPVIKSGKPVTFELLHGRLSRSLLVTVSRLGTGKAASPFAPPAGAVCTVRDLSELRAAEAVAREQRGFLAKLIEHADDAIAAISPDGKLIWFNEQLTKLSGYTREELFSADTMRFPAEGQKRTAKERFTKALAGEAQTFEMRVVRQNGESRLLLVTYTPIYDKGRVSSVLCIARDITQDRIAAERAAQADKLRALGQLASGVAHNFNNVLAAILGHAQLIRRENTEERMLRRLDVIEQAALDGAQTVKRIQGFALKPNEEAFQPIDINQLVHDSAKLTRARWADDAQANGLTYSVELDLQPTPLTRGSASELREVFVNIIFNALDAMPQGGRLVIATLTVDAKISVSFADNGVGMSRPIAKRVFEPFFTTKGANGMGLGLAVSYSIVERHGGTIEADSNPGRGTTFTVTLPLASFEKKRSEAGGQTAVRSVDILVIDDDEPVREALVGMLTSAGHTAEAASSGAEGLLKMESHRFNVVLTDLSMPEMDGFAVADEIRRRWPETKIVLVTGYILPAHLGSERELVDAVVTKPVKLDDLTNALGEILSE